MTILVDAAIWPWRGQRWAHLVSDSSIAELHAFAEALGIRRLAFGGDHYDVSAAERAAAVGAGARATEARDLVAALRAAHLRCPPPHSRWKWQRLAARRNISAGDLDMLRRLVGPADPAVPAGSASPPGGDPVDEAQWAAARSVYAGLGSGAPVDALVLERQAERAVVLSQGGRPTPGLAPQTESKADHRLSQRITVRGRTTTYEFVALRASDPC